MKILKIIYKVIYKQIIIQFKKKRQKQYELWLISGVLKMNLQLRYLSKSLIKTRKGRSLMLTKNNLKVSQISLI